MQSLLLPLSVMAVAAVVFSPSALAQVVESPHVICSSRLSGIEKARCLVEQRNAILRQLGRLPPASASSSISSVSSVPSVPSEFSVPTAAASSGSANSAPRSCSRMKDRAKALCLVEQRKEILRQLASQPPVASIVTVPVPRAPARANCTRLRNPAERVKCHSGNRTGSRASSTSSAIEKAP